MLGKLIVLISAIALLGAQTFAQIPSAIVLDDGTPIRLRTTQTITSAEAHTDDRVDFEVVDDVKVGARNYRHRYRHRGTIEASHGPRRQTRCKY